MELFGGENLAESQWLVMLFHVAHAFWVTCFDRVFASSPFGLLTSPNFIDREGLGRRCTLTGKGKIHYGELDSSFSREG